ncbi:MAG: PqqD family protein [Chloroflexi bacterium]|nr:PqqD family protein [Chloroflexota bacterium]MCI0648192.1 PqqD family protein [Chloroflexota bacterium]MCI0730334.1 PqqD family protein [Chloroflexota bacterium]
MVTLASVVKLGDDVVFTTVDNEAVLLELTSGEYYGLDEVGTRMWALLAEHGRLEPVYRQLLEEYEVDGERLRQDLCDFVDKLAGRNLLELL